MILDTNALSAWAEGLATVEAPFDPPIGLPFPALSWVSIISASVSRATVAAMRIGFTVICRGRKS